PPGRARLSTKLEPMGSATDTEYDWNRVSLSLQRSCDQGRRCEHHIGLEGEQLFREYFCPSAGRREAIIDADIAALRPSEPFEPLPESRKTRFGVRIVLGQGHQHTDPLHALGPLRARRERPRRRAAEQRDELAPSHWNPSQAEEHILAHESRIVHHSKFW